MDPWTNPPYLATSSGDDYLASLTSFLDGTDAAFPPSTAPGGAVPVDFASFGANGSGFASVGGKAPLSAFPGSFGGFGGGGQDIQINPSLLGSLPRAVGGVGGQNEPSSPELTSASSSGDSPASSAALEQPHHPQATTTTKRTNSTRRSTATSASSAGGVSHDKRKAPSSASTGAVKDRRSLSSSTSGGAGGAHSHPSTAEDEHLQHDGGRSESPELDGTGKAGKKGKTSERRRAQNRQAQRNFRERKEKHLKDLETRVLELETTTSTQSAENSALKALLEQLQSENARLKMFESAFTFTPPVAGAGAAGGAAGQGGMPQAPQFAGLPSLPSVPGSVAQGQIAGMGMKQLGGTGGGDKPPTPPTAQDELEDVSAAFKFDTSSLNFGLSPLPSAGQAQQQDDLFASFTLPSPPSASASSVSASGSSASQSPLTPISDLQGLSGVGQANQSTLFRDPLAALEGVQNPGISTFADLDALFGVGGSGAAPSTGAGVDDSLAQFLAPSSSPPGSRVPLGASPSMFPPATLASPPLSSSSSAYEPPLPAQSALSLAAAAAAAGSGDGHACSILRSEVGGKLGKEELERRVRMMAGKGEQGEGKYDFDLDGLCHEMKLKATCQEAARQALKSAMAEDAAASRALYPQQL
ncbi:hypothetical protein JCM10213_005980 [Rhodosporidiobolus nylandii]